MQHLTRTWLVAILVILLGLESPCFAQEARDGNWWDRFPETLRVHYVLGMLDGLELGATWTWPNFDATSTIPRIPEDDDGATKLIAQSLKNYEMRVERYALKVKVGQLVDGLTQFYKDFRNRSIQVSSALEVVMRQIAGEDTDAQILRLRSTPKR